MSAGTIICYRQIVYYGGTQRSGPAGRMSGAHLNLASQSHQSGAQKLRHPACRAPHGYENLAVVAALIAAALEAVAFNVVIAPPSTNFQLHTLVKQPSFNNTYPLIALVCPLEPSDIYC